MSIAGVDFSIAGKWAKHVEALALTEHYGHQLDDDCIYGRCHHGDNDGGEAFGLLQQHPAFFDEWYIPSASDTWPQAQIKAAGHFLQHYAAVDLNLVIMGYNLGIYAVMHENKRNSVYLARWQEMYKSIGGV